MKWTKYPPKRELPEVKRVMRIWNWWSNPLLTFVTSRNPACSVQGDVMCYRMSATRFSLRNPISRRFLLLNKAGLVAHCGTVTNCKEYGDFLSIYVQRRRDSRHFPPFTKLKFRYRILKDPLLVPVLCCILRGPGGGKYRGCCSRRDGARTSG